MRGLEILHRRGALMAEWWAVRAEITEEASEAWAMLEATWAALTHRDVGHRPHHALSLNMVKG